MAQDWLKLCNNQGVPLEDFKRQFCDRCLQSDCTRSIAGSSKFDQRVNDWEERLFLDPPRMDPRDPNYQRISAQKFITVDTGPIPEVGAAPVQSDWVDPLTLDVAVHDGQKEQVVVSESVEVSEPQPLDRLPPEPARVPPPEPVSPPLVAPGRLQPMNTPKQAGQMLKGHESRKEKHPAKDPWSVPDNPDTGAVEVVVPGARIRFDGSGV